MIYIAIIVIIYAIIVIITTFIFIIYSATKSPNVLAVVKKNDNPLSDKLYNFRRLLMKKAMDIKNKRMKS